MQLFLYVYCALGFPEVLGHMLHGHEAKARAVARAARAKAGCVPWRGQRKTSCCYPVTIRFVLVGVIVYVMSHSVIWTTWFRVEHAPSKI